MQLSKNTFYQISDKYVAVGTVQKEAMQHNGESTFREGECT